MEESIRDMLARSFDDEGNFDGEVLRHTLYDAGYKVVAEKFSVAEEYALAAAIEYFDGDIEQSIAAIERGEYRHCPDAQDYDDLGNEIIWQETNHHSNLPEFILDYIDFELLGKDVANNEQGQFTHFGYFAPEKR